MKQSSIHQHYRTLRTFCSWCIEPESPRAYPMRGMTMRIPKTFPRVPDEESVRRLLPACSTTFEGRRNKAFVAPLADSGLRITEALGLTIGKLNLMNLTVHVPLRKSGEDGI